MTYTNYVTTYYNHYNLIWQATLVISHYCKFNSEISDDVKLLVTCEICANAIIEVLQKKYLGKYIHTHNIYNIV